MFQQLLLSFTSIFVALDIIGTLPLYAAMTRGMSEPAKRKTLNTSAWVAFVVAMVFLFIGERIFSWLSIALFDFKIAGGIVLLLISLADLLGRNEAQDRGTGSTGIVPLAVPLITGPGVLTTLILQVNTFGILLTIIATVLNYALAWYLLLKSDRVTRAIGNDGTTVISKIAALLLAAIAVAMIRSGIFEAVREFSLSVGA